MDSIGKKRTVMMNGFLLRTSEGITARKIEHHMHKISPEWICISDLNRMMEYKIINGNPGVRTKSTVMKLYIYYNKEHPRGYTMEHKRFGMGDYFRIVKME
jgi:hypothetical protein